MSSWSSLALYPPRLLFFLILPVLLLLLCIVSSRTAVVTAVDTAKKDPLERVPPTIYSFPNKQKYLALTFDDGPHAVLTHRLLDALKDSGAHVTFFVMGIKVLTHPEIVVRAMNEGHEIANHVWNHPVIAKLPWEAVSDQLRLTSEVIRNATGTVPRVMRPPYGNTNKRVNERIAKELGLPVIMWSLDTLDWKRPGVAKIVEQATKRSKPGTVILCHDIHPDTVEAIPKIVEQMRSKGYEFKTVSQLIDFYYRNSSAVK